MELLSVLIEKPEDLNLILGQSHFIKTVEDLYEVLAGTSPHLRFGLAFCESSGPRLVRREGNDDELIELATRNALNVGAGHSFIVFLRDGQSCRGPGGRDRPGPGHRGGGGRRLPARGGVRGRRRRPQGVAAEDRLQALTPGPLGLHPSAQAGLGHAAKRRSRIQGL